MKHLVIIVFWCFISAGVIRAAECDEFVTLVKPAKDAYIKSHRVYPIPARNKLLALKFMPRIWTHPESWQPIAFEDYLARASLVRNSDRQVMMKHPTWQDLVNFAAMGFWRSGDMDLLHRLEPLIANDNPMHGANWEKMVALMRNRLADALKPDTRHH